MRFDPSVRDTKTWQMIAPGLWLDPAGEAHWFPDEVAAELGIEYNEETYAEIIETIAVMTKILVGDDFEMNIIKHTREFDA